MDGTGDFFYFTGGIDGINNTCTLSEIKERKGNTETIDYAIQKLLYYKSELIGAAKYYDDLKDGDYSKAFRKYGMFLILNAGFTEFLSLELDYELERHLRKYVIPKCMLVEMLWNLDYKCVCEPIIYTIPHLSLELAELIVDYLKYDPPTICVEKVKVLAPAIYRQICRLHYGEYKPEIMSSFLNKALNIFQRCIEYLTHISIIENLKKRLEYEIYEFKGCCLYVLLDVTYKCLNKFLSTEDIHDGFDEIFKITFPKKDFFETNLSLEKLKICKSKNEPILECLNKCNIFLLDKCNELVMDVNVDQFCSWYNFKYVNSDKCLQELIGEFAYIIHTKLLEIENLSKHPVVTLLESIAITPVTILEIINYTDTETIVNNIRKNDDDSILWVRALLSKDNLCADTLLVEQIESNIQKHYNQKECHILYDKFKDYYNSISKDEKDNKLQYKLSVTFKLFQNCTTSVKYKLIDDNFKDNYFHDGLKMAQFDSIVTECFNKFAAASDRDYTDILTLFLQSPLSVYIKLFSVAVENTHQKEIMLNVIELLQKYSCYSYKGDKYPCLIQVAKYVLENLLNTDIKKENYIDFMIGLKKNSMISGDKVITMIVMPMIYEKLVKKDIVYLNIAIRLLQQLNTLEELLTYRAPMLVILSQMMDSVRWNFQTFDTLAPDTMNKILKLQMILLESFGEKIPEYDKKWLKAKVGKLHPMNAFYFRVLWKLPYSTFLEVISGSRIHKGINKMHLVIWLMEVISSSTPEEWMYIWDSLEEFGDEESLNIFYKVLVLLTENHKKLKTKSTKNSLQYYFKNFTLLIKDRFLKEPLADFRMMAVLRLIVTIGDLIENVEDLYLPLIAYMLERNHDCNSDISRYLRENLKTVNYETIKAYMIDCANGKVQL